LGVGKVFNVYAVAAPGRQGSQVISIDLQYEKTALYFIIIIIIITAFV